SYGVLATVVKQIPDTADFGVLGATVHDTLNVSLTGFLQVDVKQAVRCGIRNGLGRAGNVGKIIRATVVRRLLQLNGCHGTACNRAESYQYANTLVTLGVYTGDGRVRSAGGGHCQTLDNLNVLREKASHSILVIKSAESDE